MWQDELEILPELMVGVSGIDNSGEEKRGGEVAELLGVPGTSTDELLMVEEEALLLDEEALLLDEEALLLDEEALLLDEEVLLLDEGGEKLLSLG